MEVPAVVKLQAGERVFAVSKALLLNHQTTFFRALFNERLSPIKTEEGHYFLDRDPDLFACIVKVLRDPRAILEVPLTMPVLNELEYFQLSDQVIGPNCILLTGGVTDNVDSLKSYAYFPAIDRYMELPDAGYNLKYSGCVQTKRGLVAVFNPPESNEVEMLTYSPSGTVSHASGNGPLECYSLPHENAVSTNDGKFVYIPHAADAGHCIMMKWDVEADKYLKMASPLQAHIEGDPFRLTGCGDSLVAITVRGGIIWTYDYASTCSWKKLPFNLYKNDVFFFAAASAGEFVYVMSDDPSTYVINMRTLKVCIVYAMEDERFPIERRTTVACDDRLFLFGGHVRGKSVDDACFFRGTVRSTIRRLPIAVTGMAAWTIPTSHLVMKMFPSFN